MSVIFIQTGQYGYQLGYELVHSIPGLSNTSCYMLYDWLFTTFLYLCTDKSIFSCISKNATNQMLLLLLVTSHLFS